MNKLYFGDNLWHLTESINDESVDLVYLDPPFNSQAQYNVFFKTPEGVVSEAQAEAFRDTKQIHPDYGFIGFMRRARSGGRLCPYAAPI
jgi:16S rRNA G966 N2-methylase RsmD